jgi:hypothetical protein
MKSTTLINTIDTTGTGDWGFVSVAGGFFDSNLAGGGESHTNTDFGSVDKNDGTIITTVNGSSSIGSVTLTEGTTGTDTISPQGNVSNYTFDGTIAHGAYGNFAPTEQNFWQMTFNDLGVGEFDITLYMGHSTTNRGFDIDVTGTGIGPLPFYGPLRVRGSEPIDRRFQRSVNMLPEWRPEAVTQEAC